MRGTHLHQLATLGRSYTQRILEEPNNGDIDLVRLLSIHCTFTLAAVSPSKQVAPPAVPPFWTLYKNVYHVIRRTRKQWRLRCPTVLAGVGIYPRSPACRYSREIGQSVRSLELPPMYGFWESVISGSGKLKMAMAMIN